MFPESMLSRGDIAFFGLPGYDGYQAGCIANSSRDCVGLSNVFARTKTPEIFRSAAFCTTSFAPDRPLAGYDHAEDLRMMSEIGFQPVGTLRVWVKDGQV